MQLELKALAILVAFMIVTTGIVFGSHPPEMLQDESFLFDT